MTAEEYFSNLNEKYGEDFNWFMLPFTNLFYVEELNKELGERAFKQKVFSVAKCESNDDVLFLINENDYRIYHLTYSKNNLDGFPKYTSFDCLQSAIEFIEQKYVEEYL